MSELLIITNNPKVAEKLSRFKQDFCESYEDVLKTARNHVHAGARLVTHPLAGSVKPGESPYRSVVVDTDNTGLDMQSLEIIENALDRYTIMVNARTYARQYNDQILADFQVIDGQLLLSGLSSIQGVGTLPSTMA
ncbi:GrdX family protein [Sansalvadorimonas sp. 2012CJ34-2]|uniref:GrdX family protein n=1 Tax=Parendozoicomonas callyspongiae TaxID=2942213 RepID=A0ABT0PDQ0_9GAMM|nr:GrdX family protein [Sansalvadorimonas sp. 2012CJ34-2]MCL6269508.1 GrdX family protein [Sansalvadorimonas sp. 2012CJ34-2]